ncbi:MAG: phosphate acyltransferase PlsX [Clostridia bacterium]|nr:phosphate acyltransferase PlsX [Clostridia bacterium]
MKILIDAMGGDHAPEEILKGTAAAAREYDFTPVLVGDTEKIRRIVEECGIDLPEKTAYIDAKTAVKMEDSPLAVRGTPDNSMRVGLCALRDGKGDAFVSAGNTGALQMGANIFVHRIPGITRPAIGTVLPLSCPVLLLDSGANATFSPELLCQYALMGSVYMKKVRGVKKPRVGLLNIGSEPHKGTPDHAQAYALLCELAGVNFIGNVEPTALMNGACDVLVCDGFSGNILLKTIEGMNAHIFSCIDRERAEAGEIGGEEPLLKVKKTFDPREYVGAPLIGVASPVIKAHGNSDARAFGNAIAQAILYARGKVAKAIAKGLDGYDFSERKKQDQDV